MSVIQKKVCFLGEFAVGKTSLIRRFVEGKFEEKYLSTIGVAVSRKSVQLDNHTVKLLIWDLAGGDDYSNSSYLLGAAGGLISCDLTRVDTLDALTAYHQQLRRVNPKAKVVLIANKVDLEAERAIPEADLTAVAEQLNAPLFYTSAKTGQNVEEAFSSLAEQVLA
ncbi:MAG: Rab family GTPase [Chloroflexota bacterium]